MHWNRYRRELVRVEPAHQHLGLPFAGVKLGQVFAEYFHVSQSGARAVMKEWYVDFPRVWVAPDDRAENSFALRFNRVVSHGLSPGTGIRVPCCDRQRGHRLDRIRRVARQGGLLVPLGRRPGGAGATVRAAQEGRDSPGGWLPLASARRLARTRSIAHPLVAYRPSRMQARFRREPWPTINELLALASAVPGKVRLLRAVRRRDER